MKRVIIESPYAGAIERNAEYLQYCIRWCIGKGYAPMASHRMYTTALDDTDELERMLGIAAGFAWMECADEVLFFTDFGMSRGMSAAKQHAEHLDMPIREINLAEQPDAPAAFHDFISRLSGDLKPGTGKSQGD